MFRIYADGELLYATGMSDPDFSVSSPTVQRGINKAGSLTFTIFPRHPLYDKLSKLKTMMTVYQDTEMIFRGRVLGTETDIYRQKKVTCEGDYAFFVDSVIPKGEWTETVSAFFTRLVTAHNSQVEAAKQFTIGTISVTDKDTSDTFELTDSSSTRDAFTNCLLSNHGGYIVTRMDNDTAYVDYIQDYGAISDQNIEFGINMTAFTEKIDADDIFTVLRPTNDDGLTIAGVDDDHPTEYLELAVPMSKYGRIVRGVTFGEASTQTELLEKSLEYIEDNYRDYPATFNLTAIDMRLMGYSYEYLTVGKRIGILSTPHGINISPVCTGITYTLENPDNNTYEFADDTRTRNRRNKVESTTAAGGESSSSSGSSGGGGGSGVSNLINQYINATEESLSIWHEKVIQLTVGQTAITQTVDAINLQVTDHTTALSSLTLSLDGIDARVESAEGAVSSLEMAVNGISLNYVSKDNIASSINLNDQGVQISASKINLSGYVTANQLSAEMATIETLYAKLSSSATVRVGTLYADSAYVGGDSLVKSTYLAENYSTTTAMSTAIVSQINQVKSWVTENFQAK